MLTPAARAASGPEGLYGAPSRTMSPASGECAPESTFMSVLFPAPFSPMRACTSPRRTSRSTPRSAAVGPKLFRTPRISRMMSPPREESVTATPSLAQPLREIGRVEGAHLGRVHVLRGDDHRSRVHDLLHGLPADMVDERLHPQVAHADRVLEDEPLDLALLHRLDERLARVEADVLHLAREPRILEGPEHPERRRLVRGEDALDLVPEAREEVLGGLVGSLRGRTAVEVGADELDPRVLLLQGVEEALLPLHGALRALGVAKEDRLALSPEHLAQPPRPEDAPLVVVGGHVRDEVLAHLALEPAVEDDDRDAGLPRIPDRVQEGGVIERGEHDPLDAGRDEVLDDLDLLRAVVLLLGPLPLDLHAHPRPRLGVDLALGLHRPGVDGLPELVRGPLRDDRDPEPLRAIAGPASPVRIRVAAG